MWNFIDELIFISYTVQSTENWKQIMNVNNNPCVIYNGYEKTITKFVFSYFSKKQITKEKKMKKKKLL